MTTENMNRYTTSVTIVTDTLGHANQVAAEQIYYDEDYGFEYQISCGEVHDENVKPAQGIVIDASVIRDILEWTMDGLDEHDDRDNRLVRAHKHIASMSDDDLNDLISSTDNRFVWELYHDMCVGILEDVIDVTVGLE